MQSNNPTGGLGLTGGIFDSFENSNSLTRVLIGGGPASLLTECANPRSDAWIETTNMLFMTNMKRLYSFDDESVKAREGFFQLLKTDESFQANVRMGFDKITPVSFMKNASVVGAAERESKAVESPLKAQWTR